VRNWGAQSPPVSLFLHRAGVEPEDRVGWAPAHQASGQGHDTEQVEPAVAAARVEGEAEQERGPEGDADDAVDAADILGHDVLQWLVIESRLAQSQGDVCDGVTYQIARDLVERRGRSR